MDNSNINEKNSASSDKIKSEIRCDQLSVNSDKSSITNLDKDNSVKECNLKKVESGNQESKKVSSKDVEIDDNDVKQSSEPLNTNASEQVENSIAVATETSASKASETKPAKTDSKKKKAKESKVVKNNVVTKDISLEKKPSVIEKMIKTKCDSKKPEKTKNKNNEGKPVENNSIKDEEVEEEPRESSPKKKSYSREYLLSKRSCDLSMIEPDIPECAIDLKVQPCVHDCIIEDIESSERITNIFMSRRNIIQKNPMFKRKDDGEEGGGIVLGPQRRSFGTGCHAPKRVDSPTESQNADRNSPENGTYESRNARQRFGSGRIHLSLSTIESARKSSEEIVNTKSPVKWRDEPRSERRPSFNRSNDYNDRNDHNDYRSNYDRRNSNDDKNSRFGARMRGSGDNNYGQSRNHKDSSRGGRRFHDDDNVNEEPEWFTSGPESQNETIELRGFERTPEKAPKSRDIVDDDLPDLVPYDMGEDVEGLEQKPLEELENTTIDDEIPKVKNSENGFDFNVFLSECNINGGEAVSLPMSMGKPKDIVNKKEYEQSSRFSRMFSQTKSQPDSSKNTQHTSVSRSSMNDDQFAYLNDLVNGNSTPAKQNAENHIMDMLQGQSGDANVPIGVPTPMSRANKVPIGAVSAEDLERNMKSTVHSFTQQNEDPSQSVRNQEVKSELTAFNKLLNNSNITPPPALSQNYPQMKHAPLPQTPQQTALANNIPFQRPQTVNEKMNANIQAAIIKQKNIAMQQQQQQAIYQIENQIAEFMKTNPNALAKIAQKEQFLANQQSERNVYPSQMTTPVSNPAFQNQRTTSPLVFGNQPPIHAATPSAVHPGHEFYQHMPNPQTAMAHHQMLQQQQVQQQQQRQHAFLQNKKQMENHFERGMPHRSKSPFIGAMGPGRLGSTGSMHSPPVATVEPSFTPTSVIRRMANDKVELEKHLKNNDASGEVAFLQSQQYQKTGRYDSFPIISAVTKNNADVTRMIEKQLRQQHMSSQLSNSANNQSQGTATYKESHPNPQLINDYNMAVLRKQQHQQQQKWTNEKVTKPQADNNPNDNLSKWFNVDSLQQMPNMPVDLRKNNSGARILTLDEIERLQQSVYN